MIYFEPTMVFSCLCTFKLTGLYSEIPFIFYRSTSSSKDGDLSPLSINEHLVSKSIPPEERKRDEASKRPQAQLSPL